MVKKPYELGYKLGAWLMRKGQVLSLGSHARLWGTDVGLNISGVWVNTSTPEGLERVYNEVAPLKAVIDIKNNAKSNVRFVIHDLKTGEQADLNTNKAARKLNDLLLNPNPMESTLEFLKRNGTYYDVFGDSFLYKSVPDNFEGGLMNINVLNNLPSQYTKIVGTGKLFDQVKIEDIVEKYTVKFGSYERDFDPGTILHKNTVGISFGSNGVALGGVSPLVSLTKEISNVVGAMNSRNKLIYKFGALGIFSNDSKDSAGSLPMMPNDKEDAQRKLSEYGTQPYQKGYIFTTANLKFTRVSMSPKELMLLEETWQNVIQFANTYGVPDILVKLYLQGATFENQKEAYRRLYQNTVIPEMNDWVISFNKFLKLEEAGLKLVASYDHISALQEDKGEEAKAYSTLNSTIKDQFLMNLLSYNDYMTKLGLPPVSDSWGDLRYYELPDEIAQSINGSIVVNEPANT